ncbi:UDP-glucose/GDP-mannose dehydrogenase family protein [Niallia sp. XMNu-256]|uniref:UDP-glucose dehydrogenase family protein n=1 Tax=Niallia sp. XMNu-256 TaxID=3082444 RepID=UPI0030D0701F
MKIAVIGTGYVGLSTGVVLSEIGHNVVCIDVDEQKIERLQNGISPIYEPGLEPLLTKNIKNGQLVFTSSHKIGLTDSEVIILAVGTPQQNDGSADLSYLIQAAKDLTPHLKNESIVMIKSTVPVGTNDFIKKLIAEHLPHNTSFSMVSNPEFLRQGSAIKDTLHPDRIIIGSTVQKAAVKIEEMYKPLNAPIIHTSIESAEMIKYASNAFLATKISFINEIANLCEVIGANVEDVARGMGLDKRIGEAFLQAGIGYGGSCFPKDTKALLHSANLHGQAFSQLHETIAVNNTQPLLLVKKATQRFTNLKGKKFALLGLSFKPETDDMREAPSIKIANVLVESGSRVIAYDPIATDNAKKVLKDSIEYATSINEAIKDADALFLVTEWNEFKQLDLSTVTELMKQPIIFDGRNCFKEDHIHACESIEYYPVGKKSIIK